MINLKPHTLKASEVNKIKQQVAVFPQIKAAYLVEKVVTYFPQERFCILGIIRQRGWVESQNAAPQLVDLLVTNLQFPTQAYIVILNHSNSGNLKKKISQIERSLIFQR